MLGVAASNVGLQERHDTIKSWVCLAPLVELVDRVHCGTAGSLKRQTAVRQREPANRVGQVHREMSRKYNMSGSTSRHAHLPHIHTDPIRDDVFYRK